MIAKLRQCFMEQQKSLSRLILKNPIIDGILSADETREAGI